MNYSRTAFLSLLVLFIINFDVVRNRHYRSGTPVAQAYRGFILSVMAFCASDALWGVLYDARLITPIFIDTTAYFVALAASVFLWTRYVILYLNQKNRFLTLLSRIGQLFMAYIAAVLILNCFLPVMFWFDAEGVYHAADLRYVALAVQVLMFLSASVYVLVTLNRSEGRVRIRHIAIGVFGFVMTVMVIMQVVWPLQPMYAVGCLLGVCILHRFVVGDMKDDRRRELEEALRREEQQQRELGSARHMAYTDSLTGVRNTHAYVEAETAIDQRISSGELKEFGVIVFDLNSLKQVNDTRGHDAGDHYIRDACRMICRQFKHSPVYRIGGDEFVALLEDEDYRDRKTLLSEFDTQAEENVRSGGVIVATGLAVFRPGHDNSYRRVFERADQRMYDRKGVLKAMQV